MRFRKLVSISVAAVTAILVVVTAGVLISQNTTFAQPTEIRDQQDEQFAARGANTCLVCHSSPTVTQILERPHGNSSVNGSPFARQACETCHGASADHVRELKSPRVVFKGRSLFQPSDPEVQNQVCLSCHQSGERMHWAASAHQAADLSCASCHTIHTSQNAALSKISNEEVCLSCHLEQRSQLNRRSHHPVREGLMTCADCHNPHGSDAIAMLAKSSVNETCTTCHTEKRGPFLWEHQPVSEDCTTCHNPHGATQANLLSVRQPILCQSCHSEAYHPSFLYSGDDIPPAGAAQQVLGKSCTNCHSSIHGSNHPSGSRLTR